MKMNKTSYQQAEGNWAGLGYPKAPYYIRNCGCGEVAITNILIELNKYANYTPKTIQPYMKQFAEAHGNGTYHYGIPTALKHYGLTEVKEHATMAQLWKELEKGDRIAIYLMGSANGGSKKVHWTGSGHFVASVDYKTQGGKHYVYMKDSASKSSLRTGWITYEENIRGACLKVWTGKLPGAKASETVVSVPVPGALAVDGKGGPKTVKATQKFFSKEQTGTIVSQQSVQKQFYPALTAVSFAKKDKKATGDGTVKELQKWVGVKEIDGIIGKGTVAAWQKKLKDAKYYTGIIDGIFGTMSMEAWQRYLNDHPTKTEKTTETKAETPAPTSGSTSGGSSSATTSAKTDYLVVDVSYVQSKTIDWAKAKKAGVKGVIIRCGFRGYETGKLQEDNMFMNHIKGAHAAGLKIGVYFFTEGINAKEGKEEAAYALNLIKKAGFPLDYPIAVDTEYIKVKKGEPQPRANNLTVAKRTEVIKAFCEEIKRQGYEPMIYASLNWFYNNLNMAKLPYKIWCAQYNNKCQYKGDYVLWQYSSEGKVDGITGKVDMNHCYIPDSKVTTNSSKATTKVVTLTIDELAKQVLEGKWGSGAERKKNLEKAGYDYDKVQTKVNQLLADSLWTHDEVIANMKAWAKKIAAEPYKYVYYSEQYGKECPICHPHGGLNKGWQCIGFAFAIWHHGGGLPSKCNCGVIDNSTWEKILNAKTDAEALSIAQKCIGINDIKVIRNKNGIPKSQAQAGDIAALFVNGNEYQHTYFIMSDKYIADATQGKTDADDIRADRGFSGRYVSGMKVIIRWTGKTLPKQTYAGKLPTTKLVKSNAEVIADAIEWCYWIASDNSFHYGYTNKHGSKESKDWSPNAHHNGCYFCGTNVDHGGRSKKGIKDLKKTYCCNPAVTAAYAHGGCDQAALKKCRSGSSYVESSFEKSHSWKKIGKPKFSELKKGDVLYYEKKDSCHYAVYLGNGKLFEAAGGDDNVRGSKKWKNSIHVRDIEGWGSFQGAFRYIASVNATCCIYPGEVSDRVADMQEFLKWYGYKIETDRCFGDNTMEALADFQKKSGIAVDKICGPNTIKAMGKAVK